MKQAPHPAKVLDGTAYQNVTKPIWQLPDIDRRAIPAGAEIDRWTAGRLGSRAFDWPAETGIRAGSILFQGGRGDIFEKYLESFAHWHAQGWTITSFDWRGQGGSGRSPMAARIAAISRLRYSSPIFRAFYADWEPRRRARMW
jgi:lysophospholipase